MKEAPSCVDVEYEFPRLRVRMTEDHVPGSAVSAWNKEIVCKYGVIFPWGGDHLVAFATEGHRNAGASLKRLKCAEEHQYCDDETQVKFHKKHFNEVAKIMRPLKKRPAAAADHMRKWRFSAKSSA